MDKKTRTIIFWGVTFLTISIFLLFVDWFTTATPDILTLDYISRYFSPTAALAYTLSYTQHTIDWFYWPAGIMGIIWIIILASTLLGEEKK